jgi:hypothetical protein
LFSCETAGWWDDFKDHKFKEQIDMCGGGCGKRLAIAMERKGWTRDGEYWVNPDGKRKVHESIVENHPTSVVMAYPELAPPSAQVITEEMAAAAKEKSLAVARRLGVLK